MRVKNINIIVINYNTNKMIKKIKALRLILAPRLGNVKVARSTPLFYFTRSTSRIIASITTLGVLLSLAGASLATAQTNDATLTAVLHDSNVQMEITVKFGNVYGQPQHIDKTSFDGKIYVGKGDVKLIKTLYFENHDPKKDRITSKQNPVSWRSWIFDKWDGVVIKVNAHPRSNLNITTDAGGLTIPIHKLMTAEKPTILKIGDGREIVVKVNKVITDPFLIRAYWGGPVPQPQSVLPVEPIEINPTDAAPTAETAATLTAPNPNSILPYQPIPANFSGTFETRNGADMKFLHTLLFEPEHGDKITEIGKNYVAWNSYIYGHYDGLLIKAQMDQNYPQDDTVVVKFPELDWGKEYSLAKLYELGTIKSKVEVNGQTYVLVLQAIQTSLCESTDSVECITIAEAEKIPTEVPDKTPVIMTEEVGILEDGTKK